MVKLIVFIIFSIQFCLAQSKNKTLASIGSARTAFGVELGLNGAEVLGTSPSVALSYAWNLMNIPYFTQISLFAAPLQSDFSKSVLSSSVYEYPFVVSLDAQAAWRFAPWPGVTLPPVCGPFLSFGLSALWQGGEPNFGAMLGFGLKTPALGLDKERWYLQLQARDQIAAQRVTALNSSLSQNLQLALGLFRNL